jgi:hypothetical protein
MFYSSISGYQGSGSRDPVHLRIGKKDKLPYVDTGVASPYLAMLTDIPQALNPSQKLPALPILTVNSAAALLGRGFLATNQAIDRLVKGNILASNGFRARPGEPNRRYARGAGSQLRS